MSVPVRVFALIVLVVLLILLLGPATPIESETPGLDKVAHFLAFGMALWASGVLFSKVNRIVLAVLVIAAGGLTEVLQGLTGRDADWLDLLADAVGVGVALTAWAVWRGFKPRRGRLIVSPSGEFEAPTRPSTRPESKRSKSGPL